MKQTEDTKKIPLTKGKYTIVDDNDFSYLNKFKWCHVVLGNHSGQGYAIRRAKISDIKSKKAKRNNFVFMHRTVLERDGINLSSKGTDHINRNTLDNRRINLRPATKSENAINRGKQINNTSGFKGVCWHKACRKWMAAITVNQRQINLGIFKNKIDAAYTYNKAAIKYFGEFAFINEFKREYK